MAGDWIKFEIATPDKPEVWQIAESLSIDPDAVVGKLLRVWSWFDQQTEIGNAPSVSKLLLDRLVGVSGFCKVVIATGWMIDEDGVLTLPHFERHNGKTAKNRALTAKRVAEHKKNGNAKVTIGALPKEEKRREDISITKVIEPEIKKVKFDPLSLIEFMPNDLGEWWTKWIEYRKERKIKTTEKTWKGQAANLNEWGKAGHNPCLIIKASIDSGWQGLFEPKQIFSGGAYAANQQPNGFGGSKEKASPSDRIRAQARIAIERLDAKNDVSSLYADDGLIPAEGN